MPLPHVVVVLVWAKGVYCWAEYQDDVDSMCAEHGPPDFIRVREEDNEDGVLYMKEKTDVQDPD